MTHTHTQLEGAKNTLSSLEAQVESLQQELGTTQEAKAALEAQLAEREEELGELKRRAVSDEEVCVWVIFCRTFVGLLSDLGLCVFRNTRSVSTLRNLHWSRCDKN